MQPGDPDDQSSAGTPRGCWPFALLGGALLLVIAVVTILFARSIRIGPFDEEGDPDAWFVTRYDAVIAATDRQDARGGQLQDPLAVLRRDRENVHLHRVRQAGDQIDLGPAGTPYFAQGPNRAALAKAVLSMDRRAEAVLAGAEGRVQVLVHSRGRDGRLLIGVTGL